ncbi:Glutamyl-tRNA(Gln) amidotransferase subunit E [uncultured archaeon]|nr:Glutamyl-tRNA(Gln) amidotransferase subunit E [uncultured archaeon]
MRMMCGIEIHQRIAGKKLFCNCVPASEGEQPKVGAGAIASAPGAMQHETVPSQQSVTFSRRLHAVLSELGELDSAVRLESIRSRAMNYQAPINHSCLVEADEEPPHHLNHEALAAVLLFCRMLGTTTVDQVHIMRKNVIDGSNTSGFQRTAVVGTGGAIGTPVGKLGIQTVCIEEESAGIIEAGKDATADYELSRLGVPLVEIATAPTLKSGKEAQEAALAIGTLLRKTGLVQRGIGTIRQDLNVSIPDGARVEIKGVQELSMIGATVDLEVKRQEELLKLVSEIKKKLSAPIEAIFVDLTDVFSETKCAMIAKIIHSGGRVQGLKLPSHAGLLGRELVPNRRYGSELADYARSAGIRGLIHSDEDMGKYGFSEDEISEVKIALSIGASDAFVLVAGEQKKAQAAISEVACRANFIGVPEETRKASPDGTSSYMRPLPGKARMYPETDIPPVEITKELLAEAEALSRKVEKGEAQKEKLLSSVNDDLSSQLSAAKGLLSHSPSFKSSYATPELSVFAEAVKQGVEPKFAVSAITNTLQSLKREGIDTKALDEPRLLSFFLAYKKGVFAKSASQEILRHMCLDRAAAVEAAVKAAGAEKITGKALEHLLKDEKLDFKSLMAKYRLRVDAQEAQEIFKKQK